MANKISNVKIGIGFDVEQKGLTSLKKQLTDLQKLSTETYKKVSGKQLNTDQAENELKQLKKTAQQVGQILTKSFNTKLNTVDIKRFKDQMGKAGLSWEKVYKDFVNLGPSGQKAFNSLTNKVLSTNAQLKQTKGVLDKIAITLGNSIKWTVASAVVKGFSSSVQQAFGYVKSLDSSLNNIRVVTGKTAEEMSKFAVQANKAAKSLGASTTDYTDAALIYAQQGLSDQQIEARTKVTLKTANVTKQSASAVSQELTAVWNGFKINADNAQLAVDKLAAVAASSASDLQELATAMSKVASAANAMGTTEDQLAAQISTIISVTRQAPETVGAALKTIYARISDIQAGLDEDGVTLGLYSGKMAELGVNVLDASGKLRDQGQVIEEIGGKWNNLTREQQVSLAQTMAGQRQYSNLIALFDNFEQYNRMLKVAQDAEGTLNQQQLIHMDSVSAHLTQLKASIQGVQDSLINTDSIKKFADSGSQILGFVENFIDSLGGGIGVLNTFGSIATNIFSVQIAKGINGWINNIQRVKNNTTQVSDKYKEIQDIFGQIQKVDKKGVDRTGIQSLLGEREKAMGLIPYMSQEEYNGFQEDLQNITNLENQLLTSQKKLKDLRQDLSQYHVFDKEEGNQIELGREHLQKLNEETQDWIEKLKELKKQSKKTEGFSQAMKNVQGYKVGKAQIKELQEELKQLEEEQIKRQAQIEAKKQQREQYLSEIDSIKSKPVSAQTKSDKQNRTTKGNLSSVAGRQIKQLEEESGRAKKRIDELNDAIKNLSKRQELKDFTKDFSKLLEENKAPEKLQKKLEEIKKLQDIIIQGSKIIEVNDEEKTSPQAQEITQDWIKKVEDARKQIKIILDQMINDFSEANATIKGELNKEETSVEERIRLILEAKRKKEETQAKLDQAERVAFIRGITDTVSGVMQLTNAFQQLKNLGSIFNKADISAGEKFTQIFTNLTFTAPTLFNGVKKISSALGGYSSMTLDAAKETKGFNQKLLESKFAFGLTGQGAEKAGLQIRLFNTVIQLNPIMAAITALTALAGAYSLVTGIMQEKRRVAIDEANATIENQKKVQEELKSNKQLSDSLKELQKKYEDGQLTRLQLKNSVEEIIQQYGLQSEAVDRLRDSYLQLNGAVKNFDIQLSKESTRSLKAERDAAFQAFYNKTIGKFDQAGTHQVKEVSQDNFEAFAKIDDFVLEELSLTKEELENIGIIFDSYTQMNGNIYSTIKAIGQGITKGDAILEQYNRIKALQDLILEKKDSGQITRPLENIRSYQLLLEQFKRAEGTYENAIEIDKRYKQQITANAILNSGADFSNIKSYAEYLKEFEIAKKSIQQLQKANPTEITDVEESFKTFARKNISEIYNKYNDSYIEAFNEQAQKRGLELDTRTKQTLFNFNDNQVKTLANIDMAYIDNDEKLLRVLTAISNLKFDNVISFLKAGDVEKAREAAQNKYSILSSLGDQVKEGKTVSSSQMKNILQSLPEEEGKLIAGYFSQIANGSYQMTKNFQEFSQTLQKLSLSGLQEINNQLNKNIELADKLKNSTFNTEDNIKKYDVKNTKTNYASIPEVGSVKTETPNNDIINQQLKLLKLYKELDPTIKINIQNWEKENKAKTLNVKSAQLIADKYSQIAAKIRELDSLDNLVKEQTELQHQMYDAMFPTDSDVDPTVLNNLTLNIQKLAEENKEFSKDLKENKRDAKEVAEELIRFSEAAKRVSKSFQDWNKVLESGSIEAFSEIEDTLKDTYADVLDLPSGDFLSDTFLQSASNLQLMKEALDGNVDSYNTLLELAGQDLLINIGFDKDKFYNDRKEIYDLIYDLTKTQFPDLVVGAKLDNQDFLKSLSEMVSATFKTAKQATDYLASMGIDAEVIQQDINAEELQQTTDYDAEFSPKKAVFHFPDGGTHLKGNSGRAYINADTDIAPIPQAVDDEYIAQSLIHRAKTRDNYNIKQHKAFSLRVTSANKKSGGDLKFKHKTTDIPAAKGSKGGGGGGEGGGGGSKPDTSKKDLNKPIKDSRDRYHDVNIKLNQIGKTLSRTAKEQDKLYGKDFTKNLQKQIELYKLQAKTLKDKLKIHKQDVDQQKEELKTLGAIFDKYGNMTNYQQLVLEKQNKVNELLEKQNEIIKQYNATTDSETKKSINERLEEAKKVTKEAQDDLNDLVTKIGNYDKARQNAEGTADEYAEAFQKQFELRMQAFNYKIQIRVDYGEAMRDYSDFISSITKSRKRLFTRTPYDELKAESIGNIENFYSYFQSGQVKQLYKSLIQIENSISNIRKKGTDKTYGNDISSAIKDWESILSQLREKIININELKDQIDEVLLNNFDIEQDTFNKQVQKFDTINNLLQHRLDLTTLLYGDKNYSRMAEYYKQMNNNNKNQISTLKSITVYWKQLYESAYKTGDTELIQKYAEKYKESFENLNSYIQNSLNTLYDAYTNRINLLIDRMDKAISNNLGTDYINKSWDLMKQNERDYLDTINSAFALEQIRNNYDKAINDTTAIKNQKALKQLMNQQLKILKEKEKISQYDVDRANKLLELEQARIALEEARNNKVTMRLKRDSQGNYSYEYVANEAEIEKSESEYAAKRQDLYNFDKQRFQNNLETLGSRWESFKQQISEVYLNEKDEKQRIKQINLITEKYTQAFNDLIAENDSVRENLKKVAYEDYVSLYGPTAESAEEIANKIIPQWNSGMQEMINKIKETNGGFAAFWKEQQKYFESSLYSFEKQQNIIKNAGKNLSIEDIYSIDKLSEVKKENEKLTQSFQAQTMTIKHLRGELTTLYEEQEENLKKYVNSIEKSTKNLYEILKEMQEESKLDVNNQDIRKIIKGIAGNSIYYQTGPNSGGWGANQDIIKSNIKSLVGSENIDAWWNLYLEFMKENKFNKNTSLYKGYSFEDVKKMLASFDSGGYTGNWLTKSNNNGALAVLHQKELVLNQNDTKNMLDVVKIVRSIISSVNFANLETNLYKLKNNYNNSLANEKTIKQNVHIEANFPNVSNSQEIENAFNNLVNLAAQRVMR